MVYNKSIKIHGQNLGREVTWMFSFEAPPEGIFKDRYSPAWRIATFPAQGSHTFTLTYSAQLVFTMAQKSIGIHTSPATYQTIDPGQKTTLKTDNAGSFYFTAPEPTGGETAVVVNGTNAVQPIGFGFIGDGGEPETIFVFEYVPPGDEVPTEFEAKLMGYTITDRYDTKSVKASIQSSSPRWTVDMADARTPTDYNLKYNEETCLFTIVSR